MARPNKPRDIRAEEYLAQRVRIERLKRGWTPKQLAAELNRVDCPTVTSAIYKIEDGGDGRRRISVDELIAFSLVFKIGIEELLLPPELLVSQEAVSLLEQWAAERIAVREAARRRDATYLRLQEILAEKPDLEQVLRARLDELTEGEGAPADLD